MPLRAVLFDMNGVIVDDEPIHGRLYGRVLNEEGIPATERTYEERYLGMDDRGVFSAALRDAGRARDAADPSYVARLVDRKAGYYLEAIRSELKAVPGAVELVRACAVRWPIAVVSGALRQEIELALAGLGIRDLFGGIVAQDDMNRGKPDPEGYLRGAAALRVEPAGCVVVEDSLPGIEAARRAGMRSVAVATTHPVARLREAGADLAVATLEGLGAADIDAIAAAGPVRAAPAPPAGP